MAVRTITTKLALDDESEFRAQLQNINAEIWLHKSELEMRRLGDRKESQ